MLRIIPQECSSNFLLPIRGTPTQKSKIIPRSFLLLSCPFFFLLFFSLYLSCSSFAIFLKFLLPSSVRPFNQHLPFLSLSLSLAFSLFFLRMVQCTFDLIFLIFFLFISLRSLPFLFFKKNFFPLLFFFLRHFPLTLPVKYIHIPYLYTLAHRVNAR